METDGPHIPFPLSNARVGVGVPLRENAIFLDQKHFVICFNRL